MSESKPKTQFVIIHETVLQSWLRDASSFSVFAGLIGLGVFLENSAMQWAGFMIAVIIVLSRAGATKIKRMTRDEAVAYLQSEDCP